MTIEQTLSIIKPDAVSSNNIGEILSRFEKAGLKVIAAKMLFLSTEQTKAFYNVHAHRPFFEELISFMTTGPVLITVLEGENAIAKNRDLMGATNPKDAAPGTIRADFAKTIDKNAIHGSDSPENAKEEITFFFKPQEIFSR
ncbi:MAG: Nucleoside diphosphate kinase [Chlamydiae bacterium]|nr:Nucleoside diphosphate kinase [Chlamydiota bacterium]